MSRESAKSDPTRRDLPPTMPLPVGGPPSSNADTTAFDASAFTSRADGSTPGGSKTSALVIPESFGRYRVVKLLGRGGMGSVYLAHDTQLDRPVALKIPRLESDSAGKLVTRFLREARAVALLNHANICPVYDVGQIDGVHFLAMAYIKGKPLSEFLDTNKPQPERGIALTVYKVALALEEAHGKGILHRDLKPANIVVDSRGEPMVMDFGLSHRLNEEQSRLTQEGTVVGTPAYMAPEQIDDRHPIGPATDVYSLGVVLYELLTGRCPFQGTMVSVIGQVLHAEPKPIADLRADVSPALAAICQKAMAKQPGERYASMKELASALAAYIKGKPTTTFPAAKTIAAMEGMSSLESLLTTSEAATLAGTTTSPLLSLPRKAQNSPAQALWFVIPAGLGIAVLVGISAAFWGGSGSDDVALLNEKRSAESAAKSLPQPTSPVDAIKPPPVIAEPLIEPEPSAAESIQQLSVDEEPAPELAEPAALSPSELTSPADEPTEFTPSPEQPPSEKPEPPSGDLGFPAGEETGPQPSPQLDMKSVQERFEKADRNHDGKLDPTEAPFHVILRADENKDRKLTLEEAERAFERLQERLFAEPTADELKRLPRNLIHKKPMRRPGPPGR